MNALDGEIQSGRYLLSVRYRYAGMKKAWLIWFFASVILIAYVVAGFVASHVNSVEIRLEPDSIAEMKLLRLADDYLRIELEFQGDHRLRPELGEWATRADGGRLTFEQAGSSVRMSASTANSAPVLYEAMPRSAHSLHASYRNMTSDLSIQPGVWRWPPDHSRDLVVHPGFNTVKIQTVSVDAPLVGEVVRLMVIPPLTFKACMPGVCWLWGSSLWPLIVFVQAIWAGVITIVVRRKRTT